MSSTQIQKVETKVVHPVAKSLGDRFGINMDAVIPLLLSTSIRGTRGYQPSSADAYAFAIVANQYGLNPFTKEVHAFCDGERITPIVGVDGWARIVNSFDKYDGCDFEFIEKDGKLDAITCSMYVKGRQHPTRVTEYMSECRRPTKPWEQMPRRMLRHKAFMQAARYAFSIAGIYDADEAADIIDSAPSDQRPATAKVLDKIKEMDQVTAALDAGAAESQTPASEPSPASLDAGTTIAVSTSPAPTPAQGNDKASEAPPLQVDPVLTWKAFCSQLDLLAMERNVKPSDINIAKIGFAVGLRMKGKEDQIPAADLQKALDAAYEGRGRFAAFALPEVAQT